LEMSHTPFLRCDDYFGTNEGFIRLLDETTERIRSLYS
jgi:hypothetical protein